MPLPSGPMGGLQAAAPAPPDDAVDPSGGGAPDLESASSILAEVLKSPELQSAPGVADAIAQVLDLLGGGAPTPGPGGPPPGPGPM